MASFLHNSFDKGDKMTRRLFLFAGYDRDGIIDPTLVWYLRALSDLGDIILVMDCDVAATELARVRKIPHVLHASATRHGEYDFGSYKRAYAYAADQDILKKYDWVYLVNDSVYGPLGDLGPLLKDLESRGTDFVGMLECTNPDLPRHIQSWFVGLGRRVATSDLFRDFIMSVRHQERKALVVYRYEMRMTQMLVQNNYTYTTAYTDADASAYVNPTRMARAGMPFIKKAAINAANPAELLYPYMAPDMAEHVRAHAARNGIKLAPDDQVLSAPYVKRHRFTMFSIPLVTVWYKELRSGDIAYKICIFDKLPVFKLASKKQKV